MTIYMINDMAFYLKDAVDAYICLRTFTALLMGFGVGLIVGSVICGSSKRKRSDVCECDCNQTNEEGK